jgi:hypothetical protein
VTTPPILIVPAHHPLQSLPDLIRDMLMTDPGLFAAAIVVDDGNETEWEKIFDAIRQIPLASVLRRETNGGRARRSRPGPPKRSRAGPTPASSPPTPMGSFTEGCGARGARADRRA